MQSFKSFIHQRSSSLVKFHMTKVVLAKVSHDHYRTPLFVELIVVPVEDIETGFMPVKWTGQLMTAGQLTLGDLKLKFFDA